jgi:hypothetical protein
LDATHDAKTLAKYPTPFFANEDECRIWNDSGGNPESVFVPSIEITSEALIASIDHVEQLAEYIDSRMEKAWLWREPAREDEVPGAAGC